jgi:acyl carrier protein
MTPPTIDIAVQYLKSKQPELTEIPPDLDLIESRVLDSVGFVGFLVLLAEHTGEEIRMEEVTPEDFRTLDAIEKRFFGAGKARS